MAKTELTKKIEKALNVYNPVEIGGIKINQFRGSHIAFEVPAVCGFTEGGLIDAVQISEYFKPTEIRFQSTPDILVICFEIKISKSDFKSKNGHNFVGNLNYYVVPKDLYPQIADLVPENVGVLVFYEGGEPVKKNGWTKFPFCGLRKKKDSVFVDLTDEDQKWMILSVLKRIRRSSHKEERVESAGSEEFI